MQGSKFVSGSANDLDLTNTSLVTNTPALLSTSQNEKTRLTRTNRLIHARARSVRCLLHIRGWYLSIFGHVDRGMTDSLPFPIPDSILLLLHLHLLQCPLEELQLGPDSFTTTYGIGERLKAMELLPFGTMRIGTVVSQFVN